MTFIPYPKHLRLILFCALSSLLPAGAARADAVVYNNLGGATADADPIATFGPIADSFSTGSYQSTLSSVTVLLNGTADGGSVAVQLLSDSGDGPGSVVSTLGTLADASFGSTLQPYTVTPQTALTLDPSTRYWVNLVSNQSSAAWAWSYGIFGAQGVSGEFLSNVNGVFANTSGAPYQMEVLTSSPEPAYLAVPGACLLGLVAFLRRRREGVA